MGMMRLLRKCDRNRKGQAPTNRCNFFNQKSMPSIVEKVGATPAPSTVANSETSSQLIPGICDDVSMLCLSRISVTERAQYRSVSRAWRDAFDGNLVESTRCREGLKVPILFLCCGETKSGGKRMLSFQVCDSGSGSDLKQLPHLFMPWLQNPFDDYVGFCTLAVGSDLLLIGGRVYSQLHGHYQPMKEGYSGAWMFSMAKGSWESLPPLCHRDRCHSTVASSSRKVFVAGGDEGSDPESWTVEMLDLEREPLQWKILNKQKLSAEKKSTCLFEKDHILVVQNGTVIQIATDGADSWYMVNRVNSGHSIVSVAAYKGRLFGVEKSRGGAWLVYLSGDRWERVTKIELLSGRTGADCTRQFLSQVGENLCLLDTWISFHLVPRISSASKDCFKEVHTVQSFVISLTSEVSEGIFKAVVSQGPLPRAESAGFVRGFSVESL